MQWTPRIGLAKGRANVTNAYVYIMASASRTIYVGVTSNLEQRVWKHKARVHDGFTKRYDVTKLVWFEEFSRMDDAIAWEKSLKGKTRQKKIALVGERNPRWNDLAWDWFKCEGLQSDGEAKI